MQELQSGELALWQGWKKSGDEAQAQELLTSLEPLVHSQLSPLRGRLPDSVINAKGMVLARKALDTYDPKRGAKLSTHVANQVMPVHRLVYRYTNVGKIPEDRIRMVRTYQETIESLRDELNRRPSDAEIADRMNLPVKKVGLLRREAWRDVVDSGFMASLHPFVESDKAGDMLDFVYHDLGPRERVVFEHVVGYNGRKPAKSMQQVANLSGVPLTEVRKIKRSIATKIEGMR